MMSLLGGMGGMGGPGGGINPMMMLMLANMGRDGRTDPELEEYLNKSWEKGKRQLSIGVNYGSVPMEYGFMEDMFGFPSPSSGSFMQPSSLQSLFSPSYSNYANSMGFMGSKAIPTFPQM